MKKLSYWISELMLVGFLCFPAVAHQAGQPPQEPLPPEETQEGDQPPTESQPPAEPVKPPRVVGEAQSQEELEAWKVIVAQESMLDEQAALAQKFLETFPESGLTPYAHQILALNYYRGNDMDNFTLHAEQALAELPDIPDLLTPLAFIYAEKGQSSKAIEKANSAIQLLDTLEKPAEVPPDKWVDQIEQLRADSYYALGRSYLARYSASPGPPERRAENTNLKSAIANLNTSLQHDVRHDYSYFRLGFAYANANEAEDSLQAYGRAAALGGVASAPARDQMQKILEFVGQNLPDSPYASLSVDEVIAQEQAELQEELAAQQQARQEQSEEFRRQELEMQQQMQPSLIDTPPSEAPPAESQPPPPAL